MARRSFLRQLAALPFATLAFAQGQSQTSSQQPAQPATRKLLHILMKSAWGAGDPTRAAFPFLHGLALAEAGHSVQIFLLGEAVSLLHPSLAAAIVPVGWPPLEPSLRQVASLHIPIYACGACSRARGVSQADLDPWSAKFGSPAIFVSLVEWADRILTE